MKAKKLVLLAVASLTLSGCSIEDLMFWKDKEETFSKKYDINPDIKGGDTKDKIAILEALNYTGVCYYGSDAIVPDVPAEVGFEDGGYIDLFKTVTYDESHVCKLTWSVDPSQEYYKDLLHSGDTHDFIELNFKYRTSDEDELLDDGLISWKLNKIECNSAVADLDYNYSAVITNPTYYYEKQTIAELYSITDEERKVTYEGTKTAKYASTFDICTYDAPEKNEDGTYPLYKPNFTANNPSAAEANIFRYQETMGKHFYSAPDGNWGLVRNGKDVLEIYAGSGDGIPLIKERFPRFEDKYVKLFGTMGQFCGNIQLSFISQITGVTATEKASIKDVSAEEEYEPLDADRLASLKVDGYTCEKQAVVMDGHGFSNSLRVATGTYVPGSLKNKNGKATTLAKMENGNRYTFELQVGSEKITVAYDYHTDQYDKIGLFDKFKGCIDSTKQITVKGTMRYSGFDSEKDKDVEKSWWLRTEGNPGVWTIVPFLADHIA